MRSRTMNARVLTENDSFLPSHLTSNIVENKINLTDISVVEPSDARAKTPVVESYTPSPTFNVGRKEFALNEGNDGALFTSSKPVPRYDSWDQVGSQVKSSYLPKENDTFSTSTQPKFAEKLNKQKEQHTPQMNPNKIPQSSLTRSDEVESEFSSRSPPHSEKSASQNSFSSSSQSDSNSSGTPGELPTTLPKPNPARQHRKSISMPQKVQNALIAHKLLPSKSKDTSDPVLAEFSKQEPRKLHSFKRSWFKSSLSIKFRPNNEVQKQALPQALVILNDKATLINSHEKSSQQGIRNSTYRLVKILKKHAQGGELNNGGTQLFNFVSGLKKGRRRYTDKWKKLWKRLRTQISSISTFIKKKLKLLLEPFDPDHNFVFCWYILIFFLIIICLVLVPFRLCFVDPTLSIHSSTEHFLTSLNICFIIDIFINFHTAIQLDGNLVDDHKEIAINYMKSWFWLDVISSFPYTLIGIAVDNRDDDGVTFQTPFTNVQQLFRFLSLMQVLRAAKLKLILVRIEGTHDLRPVVNGILSLIKLFLLVFFIAHWCACIWHFLALDVEEPDWLSATDLTHASIRDRYIASLYFCLTALLTVGFGDIAPMNTTERCFAIVIMLLGGCVFGYVMNSMATILVSLEDDKTKIQKKIAQFSRYMQREGLSKDAQNDIKKYLDFVFDGRNKMKSSDKEMLETLTPDLKDRFYEQMNGTLLYGNKLLADNFTKRLLYLISSKIEERTYVPGEKVFDISDLECSMYFVSKGKINFTLPKGGNPVISLKKGCYFGEKSFFTGMERTLKAQSVDFSRLLYIKRQIFLESLDSFPQDKEVFCMIKDKVLLYNDFSLLNLKCIVCSDNNHILELCPKLRYIPDSYRIIKVALAENERFNLNFVRKDRTRFSARNNLNGLTDAASNIMSKYPSKIMEVKQSFEDLDLECEFPDQKRTNRSGFPSRGKSGTLGNLRGTIIADKAGSMTNKTARTLYQKKLEELKMLRKTLGEEELNLVSKTQEEKGLFSIFGIEEEALVFDTVKSYPLYFPHNNVNKVIEKAEKKVKAVPLTLSEEMKKLKMHLKKFFRALEKERARERAFTSRKSLRNSIRGTLFRTVMLKNP